MPNRKLAEKAASVITASLAAMARGPESAMMVLPGAPSGAARKTASGAGRHTVTVRSGRGIEENAFLNEPGGVAVVCRARCRREEQGDVGCTTRGKVPRC